MNCRAWVRELLKEPVRVKPDPKGSVDPTLRPGDVSGWLRKACEHRGAFCGADLGRAWHYPCRQCGKDICEGRVVPLSLDSIRARMKAQATSSGRKGRDA